MAKTAQQDMFEQLEESLLKSTNQDAMADTYTDVRKIDPAEIDPESLRGRAEPDEGFLRLVRLYDVIVPIIVSDSTPTAPGYKYWCVTGRKRVKAQLAVGRQAIPARVISATKDWNDVLGLIENSARSNNDYDEYLMIRDLMAKWQGGFGGMTGATLLKAVGRVTGMDVATVKKRLELGKVPPMICEAMKDGSVAASVAYRVAKLPKPMQTALAKDLKANGKLTMANVAAVRRVSNTATAASAPAAIFGGSQTESIWTVAAELHEELSKTNVHDPNTLKRLGVVLRENGVI